MKSKRRGNWFDCSARREDRTSKIYKPSSGAVLAAISNGSRVFFCGEIMNKVELSIWLEKNHPATSGSPAARSKVQGVGINDAPYVIHAGTKSDPAYTAWKQVLQRAYSNVVHEKHPTYRDVTVCNEWHSFMAFRKWWMVNYREGCHLDKDLLVVGNREYGPDACVYVPQWLNNFTNANGSSRGEYPTGVYPQKKPGVFVSFCNNPITGKQHNLGTFTTPEAARSAWLNYKLSLAEQLKPEMDDIDSRIYPNVVTKIKSY